MGRNDLLIRTFPYQINLLDKSDYVLAHGLNTDDQLAFGIVYQF
ncbi:hypothetical protein [Escherichia coli]|nr:hypothetical protein [Escherichia coli]